MCTRDHTRGPGARSPRAWSRGQVEALEEGARRAPVSGVVARRLLGGPSALLEYPEQTGYSRSTLHPERRVPGGPSARNPREAEALEEARRLLPRSSGVVEDRRRRSRRVLQRRRGGSSPWCGGRPETCVGPSRACLGYGGTPACGGRQRGPPPRGASLSHIQVLPVSRPGHAMVMPCLCCAAAAPSARGCRTSSTGPLLSSFRASSEPCCPQGEVKAASRMMDRICYLFYGICFPARCSLVEDHALC